MKSLCLALVIFAVLPLAPRSQAHAQQNPQATPKQNPETKPMTTQLGKTPEGIGASVDPNRYVLGPEDVIGIRTWREPDFSFPIAIRPDGKITMPLVGDVQAADMTPMDLTASLKDKLGKYLNNPDVTVTVLEVRSKKYYMDGEVQRPGPYALVTPTKILEALTIAGGFREFADQKHVRILRGQKTFLFNYKDVIKGKKLEQNIFLENGDHVIVR
ncbi:MAG: polysaccharide biosynthesis/export family protein [Acidobacteriaceae bacterium]|nr:polysaccharide biosynthesis/export family protein [Acidobacteriaceae bacterium]